MTVEVERLARLEERTARNETDILDLRRTSVSLDVFNARMETVDLKLEGISGLLGEVKVSLVGVKSEAVDRRNSFRNSLMLPLLASLGSGLTVTIATYFLTH